MVMNSRYPYAPRDNTIETGDAFVNYVSNIVNATSRDDLQFQINHGDAEYDKDKCPLEVKHDPHDGFHIIDWKGYNQDKDWQHLMIEIGERASGKWLVRGVFASDLAGKYAQGSPNNFYVFEVTHIIEWLLEKGITKELIQEFIDNGCRPIELNGTEEAYNKYMIMIQIQIYNGTMLRIQMEYYEASRIGKCYYQNLSRL